MGDDAVALESNPTGRQAEIGFATALVGVAVWAFVEAGNYPGFSGAYPQVLAALLAAAAAFLTVRTLRKGEVEGPSRLFIHTGRFALGAALIVLYVVGISLLGYILPSLAIGIAAPLLLGFRNVPLAVAVAVGTVLAIILIFFVLLDRPLPPDVFDPILALLR